MISHLNREITVGLNGNSSSSSLIFMADKIHGLKLGFENLIIELVVPGIRLGAISVKAGRTQSSPTRPPSDSPMPFTPTTIHSRQNHHSQPTWLPSSSSMIFISCCWRRNTCRETQKIGEDNTENNFSFNSEENNQNNFFLFSEMRPLENTENTKNKNHPLSQTCFQCFLFSRTENGSWK